MTVRSKDRLINLIIINDHACLRYALAKSLEHDQVCAVLFEGSSCSEAIEKTGALKPDVLLLDCFLRDGNSLDSVKLIKRVSPQTRVIVLTSLKNPIYINQALTAGVDGYIDTNIGFDALVAGIKQVVNGTTYYSPAVEPCVKQIQNSPFPLKDEGVTLSKREKNVLLGIAEGRKSKEIADNLGISVFTVTNHRTRIKNKTGLYSTPELTRYAMKLGLIGQE